MICVKGSKDRGIKGSSGFGIAPKPWLMSGVTSAARSQIRRSGKPRMLRAMPRTRRGAALLDVIIGAIMLGIGLSVIISISSRSLATQNDGERRMVAAWLADELLNHVLVEGPIEYRRNVDLRGEYGPPFEGYSYQIDIEDIGLNMPFRVTATITWPSGRTTQQVQVQTLLTEKHGDMYEEHRREPDVMLDRDQWNYERRFGPEEM